MFKTEKQNHSPSIYIEMKERLKKFKQKNKDSDRSFVISKKTRNLLDQAPSSNRSSQNQYDFKQNRNHNDSKGNTFRNLSSNLATDRVNIKKLAELDYEQNGNTPYLNNEFNMQSRLHYLTKSLLTERK